jgi:hypothetical protein
LIFSYDERSQLEELDLKAEELDLLIEPVYEPELVFYCYLEADNSTVNTELVPYYHDKRDTEGTRTLSLTETWRRNDLDEDSVMCLLW